MPVTIVTGDRDAFQLIDAEGLVKVMATARGITETKIYDRPAVIERYGIAPELIPDFYGLKGDTSDNIPGVPGIGEKTAAELLQSFGIARGRARAHRRGQRRQAPREPPRARRGRADLQAARDDAARRRRRLRRRRRARARAGSLARSRGVPPVRAARPAAPPRGGARRPRRRRAGARRPRSAERARARRRAGRSSRASARARRRGARARRARDRGARGRAVRRGPAVALRRRRRRGRRAPRCSPATATAPSRSSRALGGRAVVAHDAKALGVVPPGLAHDTMLGAYLLEPARRGYPVRRAVRRPRPRERPRGPARRRRGCARARSPRCSASRSSSAASSA